MPFTDICFTVITISILAACGNWLFRNVAGAVDLIAAGPDTTTVFCGRSVGWQMPALRAAAFASWAVSMLLDLTNALTGFMSLTLPSMAYISSGVGLVFSVCAAVEWRRSPVAAVPARGDGERITFTPYER